MKWKRKQWLIWLQSCPFTISCSTLQWNRSWTASSQSSSRRNTCSIAFSASLYLWHTHTHTRHLVEHGGYQPHLHSHQHTSSPSCQWERCLCGSILWASVEPAGGIALRPPRPGGTAPNSCSSMSGSPRTWRGEKANSAVTSHTSYAGTTEDRSTSGWESRHRIIGRAQKFPLWLSISLRPWTRWKPPCLIHLEQVWAHFFWVVWTPSHHLVMLLDKVQTMARWRYRFSYSLSANIEE